MVLSFGDKGVWRGIGRAAAGLGAVGATLAGPPWLWLLAGAGVVSRLWRPLAWRRRLLSLAPVASFALVLAGFELLARGRPSMLALRAMAVCWLAQTCVEGIAPSRWVLSSSPRSLAFRLGLFAAFTEHFAHLFGSATARALLAWRLAAPRAWRSGWFHSLAHALARIVERSLVRAERFYAAQWLRGLGE
jgi:hypothetical protein